MPANGLRGRLRVSLGRVLLALVVGAACAGLAYGVARYTSLFALEQIEVSGGTAPVRASVREAGSSLLGASLVSLDDDAVRARLTELPTVESVQLDRAFPHTLRIVVVPEEPLAVVRDGFGAWLVSRRGRVIRSASMDPKRAVVWTAQTGLEPGAAIGDENARLALEALRHVPRSFPARIESARAADGAVTLVLGDGVELRLGTAESLALKLAVAARVLRGMDAVEQAEIGYLDVSVPERVVGGQTLNSQLEG